MHPIIPQIIGIAAVVAFLASYQMKHRRGIILLNVVSRALYILQYLLLGALSGAVLDILGALASILASKKDARFIKKHLRAVILTVDLAIVAVGLALYENLFSLLPIVGVLLHTGAFWLSHERIIRRVSLLGSPFWFVYNFVSHAYGSAVGDILTMVSIVTAMIKYRENKGKSQNV